jgi:hypothetical protein
MLVLRWNREAAVTSAQHTSTRSSTATVLVVSVAAFLASLDLFIVNIAFPEIRASLGATNLGALSWVLNGYTRRETTQIRSSDTQNAIPTRRSAASRLTCC